MMNFVDNETWLIECGAVVVDKKSQHGIDKLSSWELLVYCLWVVDYGMRNAGDLETAADLFPEFQTLARRCSAELGLQSSSEAFQLSQVKLERQYLDRFERICVEIRNAESQ